MEFPYNDSLKQIADSMGIGLHQRFTLNEASLFLRCSEADVRKLLQQDKIEYLTVTDKQIEFFGYHLIQYLLGAVSGDVLMPPAQAPSAERILRSKEVQKLTGLSRTTIWRMERKNDFPARVPLTAGSVGWRLSEIEAWMKSR